MFFDKKKQKKIVINHKEFYICTRKREIVRRSGEMAEWSNAAVLKTVDVQASGGSNPSFSAKPSSLLEGFFVLKNICMWNVALSLNIY